GNTLDSIDHAFDQRFILDALASVAEVAEIADVGARHERLAARAAQQNAAHIRFALTFVDQREQRFVHRYRHRVVTLGPVDQNLRRARVELLQCDVFAHGFVPLISASSSSLCSPSSGGWRRTCCGVPSSLTGKPMFFTLPSMG